VPRRTTARCSGPQADQGRSGAIAAPMWAGAIATAGVGLPIPQGKWHLQVRSRAHGAPRGRGGLNSRRPA
jgi:hypothetical protein